MSNKWDLALIKAFGSFDVGLVDAITTVCVSTKQGEEGEYKTTLKLSVSYNQSNVVLIFEDVQRARLPEATPIGFQLGEPYIECLEDSGLERIRYRFTDELEGWLIESARLTANVE